MRFKALYKQLYSSTTQIFNECKLPEPAATKFLSLMKGTRLLILETMGTSLALLSSYMCQVNLILSTSLEYSTEVLQVKAYQSRGGDGRVHILCQHSVSVRSFQGHTLADTHLKIFSFQIHCLHTFLLTQQFFPDRSSYNTYLAKKSIFLSLMPPTLAVLVSSNATLCLQKKGCYSIEINVHHYTRMCKECALPWCTRHTEYWRLTEDWLGMGTLLLSCFVKHTIHTL